MPRAKANPSAPAKGGSGYVPQKRARHATPGGWQHGRKPTVPPALKPESREMWRAWFASWWCAFWVPEDVPQLRLLITQMDLVHRGVMDLNKMLPALDKWGITPAGRRSLLWFPPLEDDGKGKTPVVPDQLAAKRTTRDEQLA